MKDKAIMFRFGGIGDTVSLTAVAKVLKELRGFDRVEYCVPEKQVDIFKGNPYIDKIHATRRYPNIRGYDVIKTKHGWITTETVKKNLHKKDWLILEYKFLVEENSMWRAIPPNKHHGVWVKSMNSNFVNWVDLALAWANIDPTKVPDDYKRPVYHMTEEEIQWAKQRVPENTIAVNLESSSLARTFYFKQDIIFKLLAKGKNVLAWDSGKGGWTLYMHGNAMHSFTPVTSIRQSIALVYAAGKFISADSGLSHLAEAVGVPSVVLYTTVPAWTRSKYYKYVQGVQTSVECSPCFIIGKYCPIIEHNVNVKLEGLTPKEKKLLKDLSEKPIDKVAHERRTTIDGIKLMHNSIVQKMESLKNREPECMKAFDLDRIVSMILD